MCTNFQTLLQFASEFVTILQLPSLRSVGLRGGNVYALKYYEDNGMAFLELKNIGKIYTSSGSVAVGIRGVNLAFDKGEFVAVTGASGSGKSSLLNVISGMDTYEEGELLIDGNPTSHYLQPDWEEYREKYVSFIFQDYNIIESFTVLQNVELALLYIRNKKERRARAMELLSRVGMSDCLGQRGSKLSGGQKQRTVIARALAKDSPIILADEPTGNLDSRTSHDIIELLREVSRDKLLIIVTHSFEQVEHCATRHVRIFDGAVSFDRATDVVRADASGATTDEEITDKQEDKATASDTAVNAAADDGLTNDTASDTAASDGAADDKEKPVAPARSQKSERGAARRREIKTMLKNGVTLGATIFKATPKLTVFLCSLLILGILAVFVITSFCGDAFKLFERRHMFEHIDGRVVVTRKDGTVMTESEASELAEKFGAKRSIRYDSLLDEYSMLTAYIGDGSSYDYDQYVYVNCLSVCRESFGTDIVGRYPASDDEVLLYLPIEYRPVFGKSAVAVKTVSFDGLVLKVSGVKYFYDNTKSAKVLYTDRGFATATYYKYLCGRAGCEITATKSDRAYRYNSFVPSFDMDPNKIYIADLQLDADDYAVIGYHATYSGNYWYYDYGGGGGEYIFNAEFSREALADKEPSERDLIAPYRRERVYFGTEVMRAVAEYVLSTQYAQTSLFFENDSAAKSAAARLKDAGYIAVPSDTSYDPSALDALTYAVEGAFMLVMWIGFIMFLAFFLSLCTRRAMDAFRNDMAIMRSMGIPVRVIRAGMYTRMLLSLLPAFAVLLAAALTVFLTPQLNALFVFLHAWQYVMIIIGMVALTLRVTHYQIRRLFKASVKKSLKGDAK